MLEQFPKLSETFILDEMLELERLGLKITVFALSDPGESRVHEKVKLLKAEIVRPLNHALRLGLGLGLGQLGGIRAVGSKKWFWGMRLSSWLAKEAKKREIDHLHAHFAGDAAWVAMLVSKISGIPYSFTVHAGGLFGWPYLLGQKVQAAKFVVAISKFDKDYLGGDDKIKVIHCGIDLSSYQLRQWRQERHCPQILTVARLEEKKGHTYLLEALKILKNQQVSFHATLVGGGVLEKELKAQAQSSGLFDVVNFTGPCTQCEVRKLLRNAHVFVLPCIRAKDGNMDGIPVSLMEAMAVGVPVVSTKISGIPELIESGRSGLLVEPRDVEGLTTAIEKILTDDSLRRQFIREARVKVEREFDVKKNARRVRELLLR